jgi:hypothetical protein
MILNFNFTAITVVATKHSKSFKLKDSNKVKCIRKVAGSQSINSVHQNNDDHMLPLLSTFNSLSLMNMELFNLSWEVKHETSKIFQF